MTALPGNIPKRGLALEEAAEYCGVSRNTMLRHGPKPLRIGERCVYDRRSLDLWLDKLAGSPAAGSDPLGESIGARKNALRHAANQ